VKFDGLATERLTRKLRASLRFVSGNFLRISWQRFSKMSKIVSK
jgi:hypothetical protein